MYDYIGSNPSWMIDPAGLIEISSITVAIGNSIERTSSFTDFMGTLIDLLGPVNDAGQWLNFSNW